MDNQIGDLIRNRRERLGCGRRQLAQWLNCAPDTVAAWEQGRRLPAQGSLVRSRLRQALSVDIDRVELDGELTFPGMLVPGAIVVHDWTGRSLQVGEGIAPDRVQLTQPKNDQPLELWHDPSAFWDVYRWHPGLSNPVRCDTVWLHQ